MIDDMNKLYEWINTRYEQYTAGNISEETYLTDLELYKNKLAKSEANIETYITEEEIQPQERINPSKVRSTSIAGLRKKLLEEMGE